MTVSSSADQTAATAWPTSGAATWLARAAAPTFALMAWLAANNASPIAFCNIGPNILPLDGMATMYLLMSLFHLPSWLKSTTGRLSACR